MRAIFLSYNWGDRVALDRVRLTLCAEDRRFRVEVMTNLQERLLFVPPEGSEAYRLFCPKCAIDCRCLSKSWGDCLQHSCSPKVGRQRSDDRISAALSECYQTTRDKVRFNVVLDEPYPLQVSELDQRSEV